jgi:hypothetical protein
MSAIGRLIQRGIKLLGRGSSSANNAAMQAGNLHEIVYSVNRGRATLAERFV